MTFNKAGRRRASMSGTIALVGLTYVSLIAAACSSPSLPSAPTPVPQAAAAVPASPSSQESLESAGAVAASGAAVTIPGPRISGIGGMTNFDSGLKNGLVAIESCGTGYNGYRAVDNEGRFPWTISGSNFGTSPGTVSLGGQVLKIGTWTNNSITVSPTMDWRSGPMSTWLTIRSVAGTQATTGVNIVPAISTRVFGQCTYHVAWWRKNLGLQPSPTAYGNYAGINASYVPKVGDQYQWATQLGKHTAIAIRLSGPTRNGSSTTWTVTLAEMNMDCRGGVRQFDATFGVNGNTVTIPLKHSSLGITTLYYR